jgi:hypothetical protein
MSGLSDVQHAAAPAGKAGGWAAAFGCWFAAACFLMAWWWPRILDDGRWVKFGVGVLIFEFLTIHATAMLTFGLRSKGLAPRSWVWLVALYAAIAAGAAAAFSSWVLLLSFAALLAGRVRALFRPDDPATLVATHRRVAVSAALFLVLTFATVFVPMPAGGVDAALLAQVWPERGSGLWEQRPQQALALGFLYFLLLGAVEARPPGARWRRLPEPTAGA